MKFARYLEDTQIPEWKRAYIDYRGLKKRIIGIRNVEQEGGIRLPDSPLASPKRTAFPLADDHTGRHTYGSPDTRLSQNLPGTSSSSPALETEQRMRAGEAFHSWSEVVVTRASAKDDPNPGRRPSFSNILANVTGRTSQRAPKREYATIESFYASLDPPDASFFEYLDHELEKVDTFYKEHEILAIARLSDLRDQLRELHEHRRIFYEAKARRDEPRTLHQAVGEVLDFSIGHEQATEVTTNDDGNSSRHHLPVRPSPHEYHHAKRKLKKAFQEFYRSLELLNDYRVLNLTGFRKALKKFEKVARCPSQDLYMREKVQPRRFAYSGAMEDIMREVENIFAAKFEHGDLKKSRQRLKSLFLHQAHYFSTFRSGLYFGLAIPALAHGVYRSFLSETRQQIPEWGALLEIYSVLFVPVILSLLIGLNILAWSRARINFQFIFEVDVRTAIDIHEYFEIPTIMFATLSYAFWLSFLGTGSHVIAPTTWPAIWIGFAFVILVNPLRILSRSSRLWLLKNCSKLLIPGTHPVEFANFWMGDQFCSLAFTLGHFYTIVCAYSNHWNNVWGRCSSSKHWVAPFLLSALPSFVRLVQNIRRYYDSRLPTHLINAGKYLSGIVVYGVYFVWRMRGSHYDSNFVIWCLFATLSSIYNSSWDLLMDWSLLRAHNTHRFIRRELVYTNSPWIYYFAIISNIIVRFIWVIYIPAGGLSRRVRSFIAAVLEMLRRFQWNFYRLENEQIGNTDQYRATREVPLPYSARHGEDDDDSDIEDARPERARGSIRMYRVGEHERQPVAIAEGSLARRISRHRGLQN